MKLSEVSRAEVMVLSKVFDCRCFIRLQFLFISSVLAANYLDSCFLLALTLSKKSNPKGNEGLLSEIPTL